MVPKAHSHTKTLTLTQSTMFSKLSQQDMYLHQLGPNEEAPDPRAEDECKVAEEVTHVLAGEASDGGSPSKASDSDLSDMSEGTLETEFQKLSASDKLKFNQFYLYHYQVQKQEKTSGMLHQRVITRYTVR